MAHVSAPPTSIPFDRGTWWDPDGFLIGLHTLLDTVRVSYFKSILHRRVPLGSPVLDVGCGGGFVAKAVAAVGYRVVGMDPSAAAISAAREADAGRFAVARGEQLPFASETFEAVICSEVLEHVKSPVGVLAEIARVLRPGGTLLFSLTNRTWLSRIVLIELAQRWRPTRVLPPDLHNWDRFIRPQELRKIMEHQQLLIDEVVGLSASPAAIPAATRAYCQLKRRRIGYGEAGRRIELRTGRSKALAYLGYATLTNR